MIAKDCQGERSIFHLFDLKCKDVCPFMSINNYLQSRIRTEHIYEFVAIVTCKVGFRQDKYSGVSQELRPKSKTSPQTIVILTKHNLNTQYNSNFMGM